MQFFIISHFFFTKVSLDKAPDTDNIFERITSWIDKLNECHMLSWGYLDTDTSPHPALVPHLVFDK